MAKPRLGPVAGVFVDRWNRRHTLVAANLLPLLVAEEQRLSANALNALNARA